MKSLTLPLAAAGFCALMPPAAQAENWPCFRGPTRQGISESKTLPLTWSATDNVKWKTPVPGEGWSSPIVWEDRIFLTATEESGQSCRVLCFDAATGALKWNREVFRQETGRKESRNSYATPTPATDGQRVYAVFGFGGIAAVDFDGKVLWTFITGDNGETVVLPAAPKFEVLAKNPLGENVQASPAVAQGRLFIRGAKSLFCFGK